jgi:hypothetical protein
MRFSPGITAVRLGNLRFIIWDIFVFTVAIGIYQYIQENFRLNKDKHAKSPKFRHARLSQGQALRRQASRNSLIYWISAFAAMTAKDALRIITKPSISKHCKKPSER